MAFGDQDSGVGLVLILKPDEFNPTSAPADSLICRKAH